MQRRVKARGLKRDSKFDWADYPEIGRWLAAIAKLPGWVHSYQLMPGHPLPG